MPENGPKRPKMTENAENDEMEVELGEEVPFRIPPEGAGVVWGLRFNPWERNLFHGISKWAHSHDMTTNDVIKRAIARFLAEEGEEDA